MNRVENSKRVYPLTLDSKKLEQQILFHKALLEVMTRGRKESNNATGELLPTLDVENLKNTYYGLRHGFSAGNEAGILVTSSEVGIYHYGLMKLGALQVENSVTQAQARGWLDNETIIVASPFLRCQQTAEIAQNVLQAQMLLYSPRLVERNFLKEDLTNFDYSQTLQADDEDHKRADHLIESVELVQRREILLINFLEKYFVGKTFLVAFHGGPLQILETTFKKAPNEKYKALRSWGNAEIRPLNPKESNPY
jgi:broad specificity phosphatase PhoE